MPKFVLKKFSMRKTVTNLDNGQMYYLELKSLKFASIGNKYFFTTKEN
jgi:hypothetical protein